MRLRGTPGDAGRHDTLSAAFPLPRAPMSIPLTAAQTRFLRGQAHDLKALLQVGGKGISEALVAEVDGALEHHELIKVKIASNEREARDTMIAELANRAGAALVQRIGHTAILYRPSKDHRRIVLPRP
jgi:RNA-binding protein